MDPSVQLNLCSLLQAQTRIQGEKVAIHEPRHSSQDRLNHTQISFKALEDRSERLAAALVQVGLEAGDRVLVMVPMSIDLYVILIALFRIRAVAVFIDPWVGRKRLSQFAHQVEPRVMIAISKAQILRWIPGLLPRLDFNVVVNSRLPLVFSRSLKQLITNDLDAVPIAAVSPEDPALITFTTGSTGTPKGVVRTHGFLMAQHRVLSAHLALNSRDIDLPLLPVFVLNNLAKGIPSVLPAMDTRAVAKADPSKLYQQIRDLRVTTTVGSPVIYERLADFCTENTLELDHLRSLHTGGAPVSRELILKLQGLMPRGQAHIVYGSTEAEPIASISARELKQEGPEPGGGQCVGLPDPHTRVVIIQATSEPLSCLQPLAPGEAGEIVVTGDHVNKDYYHNPEAFRQNKIPGNDGEIWHRTGDVGRFDAQGRLCLLGRVDQLVEIQGRTIYPLQVEPLINSVDGVERCAFFSSKNGEALLACCFTGVVDASVVGRIRTQLALLEMQDLTIIQVSVIPMDPRHNSKIDGVKLRQDIAKLTLARFEAN